MCNQDFQAEIQGLSVRNRQTIKFWLCLRNFLRSAFVDFCHIKSFLGIKTCSAIGFFYVCET